MISIEAEEDSALGHESHNISEASGVETFSPFWTSSREAMSKELWSPTEADSLDSGSISLNNKGQSSTWFRVSKSQMKQERTNGSRISSQFVTTSWPRTTGGEPLPMLEIDPNGSLCLPRTETERKKITRALGGSVLTTKIKLHPRNQRDHEFLRRMFGIGRWTYNQVLKTATDPEMKLLREETLNPTTGKPVSWIRFLRSQVLNGDSPSVRDHPWLSDLGYDIRDGALKDFITSMKGCWTKMEVGTIDSFKLRPRSKKKCRSESLYFRSRYIQLKENTLVLKFPGQEPIEVFTGKNSWKGTIMMDCRLQRTWNNDYYLCIPQDYIPESMAPKTDENEVENQDLNFIQEETNTIRICSLDPGVRTFQTIYDANQGFALQVGDGDMCRIFRLCRSLDLLLSKIGLEPKSKRRYALKRASRRLRRRIRNLVDEIHKQLASHLARNYDMIMIPTFETSQMVNRQGRKIRTKTARQMMCWSHFRFKQRLFTKCRQHGSKAVVVNEAYTSKTCSCCGHLKWNLGGSKVYKCSHCHSVMDRDVNGAKNIFLRNYEALGVSIPNPGAYPL